MLPNFFRFAIALILIFSTFTGFVRSVFAEQPVPALSGRVVDQAQLLSDSETAWVTQVLVNLEQRAGVQAAVLTVPTLENDSLESFSIRVVDQWKLGRAEGSIQKRDRGLLLLVSVAERKIRWEVGRGLEGELTDVFCSRVIRDGMAPFFRAGKRAEGILAGIRLVSRELGVEVSPIPEHNLESPHWAPAAMPRWKLILLLVGLGIFLIPLLFLALMQQSTPLSPRTRQGYRMPNHWGNGDSFGGGGGSGGFFGGGGGGFSGGGSSGGW